MKVVNINKAFLIGIISLIVVNSSLLIYRKYSEKETNIPKVKLKNQEKKKDKKSSFAILLEQDDGNYIQTSSNSFNQPGYTFNTEKSGCIDINGNKIADSLSYNESTKSIVVSVNSTAYCYVYFDMKPRDGATQLIDSGKLWQSGLEGDGWRYTGTNPNNHICFGTTDKDTCTGNIDAYMYRIIGVFADSSGTKYMKLIKKKTLNIGGYYWHSSNKTDTDWGSSTLKSNLNGSAFLNNTKYVPDNTWSDRIADWTWNSVNTNGVSYLYITAKNVYLHEMNKTGAPSGGVHGTTPSTKIGLMYASDYLLALGTTESLEYNSNTNENDFSLSWMHMLNNGNGGADYPYEWTISRYGYNYGRYDAWRVFSGGSVGSTRVDDYETSVRPVFYLNSDQVIKSGTGSSSDPFTLTD